MESAERNEIGGDIGKKVKIISTVAAIITIIVVIMVNFMPVINIVLEGVQSDYQFNAPGGQNFVGWQVIFYYWGPSIYIGGVTAFGFNIWLFLGMFLPVAVLLVTTIKLRKSQGAKKAILEFIAAAVLIFGAILFLNATGLCEKSVGNQVASYLKMAKESGTYTLGYWSIVMSVVMLVTGGMKIASGMYSISKEGKRVVA